MARKIAPAQGVEVARRLWGDGPFLRFGDWPKDERSQIHYAYGDTCFTHEPGVSVYPTFKDGRKWAVDCSNQHPSCRGNASSNYARLVADWAPAYLVKGTLVGMGTDGEPLLRNIQVIQTLNCKQIYVPGYDYDTPPECNPRKRRKTLYIQPTKAAITAAKKGLEARKKAPKSKKGGLDTQQAKAEGVGSGVARARDIIAGKKVNAYQVKAFFDRHRQNYINAKMKGLKPEESRAIQAWLIWGGEPLRKQAEREVAKHEKTMAKNPDNKTYTVKIFRGKHAGKTRTYKTLKAAHRACDRLDLEYGAICCQVVRAKEDSSEENPKLTRKEMQELQSRAAQERFAEAMGYENIYEWEEEKKSEQKKKQRTSNPKKTPTVHATFNKWVDAQKLAKQYPDTFEAPNIGDLKKNIKIGDFVKWNIDKERIWMIVLDVNRDTIIGIIDNKPIDTKYKLGDIAKIKFRHVYSFEPGNKSSQKKADDFLQQLEDKKQKKAKKKAPTAKALIARCQRLWEAYCKRPGITKLRTVAKHCETMKSSKAKSVKTECARCMRSVQAEAKVKGWDL